MYIYIYVLRIYIYIYNYIVVLVGAPPAEGQPERLFQLRHLGDGSPAGAAVAPGGGVAVDLVPLIPHRKLLQGQRPRWLLRGAVLEIPVVAHGRGRRGRGHGAVERGWRRCRRHAPGGGRRHRGARHALPAPTPHPPGPEAGSPRTQAHGGGSRVGGPLGRGCLSQGNPGRRFGIARDQQASLPWQPRVPRLPSHRSGRPVAKRRPDNTKLGSICGASVPNSSTCHSRSTRDWN